MSYFQKLISDIKEDSSLDKLLHNIINPFSPYRICDYFIGDEIHHAEIKPPPNAGDLLKSKDLSKLKDYDIIQCQVNAFNADNFRTQILDNTGKTRIVLLTSQWHQPAINRSYSTDRLLNHPNLALWLSTNPIYADHPKYAAFPYGIGHKSLSAYADKLIRHPSPEKTIPISNLHASVHAHLPTNHIRRHFLEFGKDSGPKTGPDEFYDTLARSQYTISTSGDREDCYRHYEAIGLGAVPVSDISENKFRPLFGDSMLYSNGKQMAEMLKNGHTGQEYTTPNKDLISFEYHKDRIFRIIEELKS